jgi:glycosyltransferase involved in cell wall biosynthesis
MRIALVNTLYAPYRVGGAEGAVRILAEGLAARGHGVSVLTLTEEKTASRAVLNGVTVYRLPLQNLYWPYSGYGPNAAERAAWHVRDLRNSAMSARAGEVLDTEAPDIVHTNNLAGFSTDMWAQAAERRMPIVHTLHDYYLMCPPGAMYRNPSNCDEICARCLPFASYRRRSSRAVEAAVGVSGYILDRHLENGFFRNARAAKVIFNSVRPAPRREPRIAPAPLVYGFIGRICPEKGLRWLLKSFTRNARPGERLVIAGTGQPAFVGALKAEFAAPSVAFLGHVDAAAFYERVDAVVVPSLWQEPFGRTVIEALAHGLPVIASNRGGIPEALEDGVTGVLVDPDQPGSLGRAMRRVSEERDWARGLGAAGTQRLSLFSEDSALAAYESVYAGVSRARETVETWEEPRPTHG